MPADLHTHVLRLQRRNALWSTAYAIGLGLSLVVLIAIVMGRVGA